MKRYERVPWKPFLISILIALFAGFLGFLLSHGGMENFHAAAQPAWTPPDWIFPVVWSILYLLMGVSAALVYRSGSDGVNEALRVYALQLALNVGWSALFFGFSLYFAAFFWLLALIAAIVVMIVRFYRVRPLAAYLQLPYLAWCMFAAALNLSIAILN